MCHIMNRFQVPFKCQPIWCGMQLEELVILEMVEKMGDPAKDEGEWIAKIDLVEDGKKLKLVEHEELGKCREECKTIQRAAQDILSDHDTDIAEKLWQVGPLVPSTCSTSKTGQQI